MAKSALIMTATITPPAGVPYLQRTDPSQRRQDYLEALEFYLEKLGKCYDAIIFIENSQSNLDELKLMVDRFGASNFVEFIYFDGLQYPPSFGKAYGEFKLLDYGIEKSKFLSQQDNNFVLWKVTGRYKIINFDRIANHWLDGVELWCHCRNFSRRWVDMYCFGITLGAYRRKFTGLYQQFREDDLLVNPEIVLRMLIDDWKAVKTLRVRQRFPVTPLISGVNGYKNEDYKSKDQRNKYLLREAARLFVPWIWV